MAQMRSADRVRKCLLFGLDRTYDGHHKTDAFDPKQTSHLELKFIILKTSALRD
jgi:hypothetical protein